MVPASGLQNHGQVMAQASSLEEGKKLLTITGIHHISLSQPAHYGTPVYAIALGCNLKFAKEVGYTEHMINLKGPSLAHIFFGCQICDR